MVKLLDSDIRTRKVLGWSGVHLLHSRPSSCSQKVRIFLNCKTISWTSHLVDIAAKENIGPEFLGINPRGLVPVLVHDGAVHIESNDIILHLEAAFPSPQLVPPEHRESIAGLLRHEDDLHMDLRTITVRFMMRQDKPQKTLEDLEHYAANGASVVLGRPDEAKAREIGFWRTVLNDGISDDELRRSVTRFRQEFASLEDRLRNEDFLLGSALSVLDIAWVVYAHRLVLCGYPLQRLHGHLWDWYQKLSDRPEVRGEIELPDPMRARVEQQQRQALEAGRSLEQICGL